MVRKHWGGALTGRCFVAIESIVSPRCYFLVSMKRILHVNSGIFRKKVGSGDAFQQHNTRTSTTVYFVANFGRYDGAFYFMLLDSRRDTEDAR